MRTALKMAWRNLLKNRRRSLNTILAIALGFAAVNVFGGFTRYINSSLRDGFIYLQAQGHLTLFQRGFLTQGVLDPERYLIPAERYAALRKLLENEPEVALVTPQLHVSGLLSNGQTSTIVMMSGRVPSGLAAIWSRADGMLGELQLYEGEALDDETVYGVGLSTGLAELLELTFGDGAVAVAPTVEGQINALDVEVRQLFESSLELLNDKLMVVPLSFAQSLYDTEAVDRVTVLLERTSETEALHRRLQGSLSAAGFDMEIRTWEDLSPMYRRVRRMFDIIFAFLFLIVLVIAAMSVINAVNMAVAERTREIGTLRAVGMRRRRIVKLFAVESGMLGVLGSAAGFGLTLAVWLGVRGIRPTWVPPMITKRVPLEVHLVPEYMLLSFLFLLALSIGAASFPARRAAQQSIVDALGHV